MAGKPAGPWLFAMGLLASGTSLALYGQVITNVVRAVPCDPSRPWAPCLPCHCSLLSASQLICELKLDAAQARGATSCSMRHVHPVHMQRAVDPAAQVIAWTKYAVNLLISAGLVLPKSGTKKADTKPRSTRTEAMAVLLGCVDACDALQAGLPAPFRRPGLSRHLGETWEPWFSLSHA